MNKFIENFGYTQKDLDDIDPAEVYSDLLVIARRVIERLRARSEIVWQLCGPISTGGFGIARNMIIFENAIDRLHEKGYVMFNQVPFENKINEIKNRRIKKLGLEYDTAILNEFYDPIFKERLTNGTAFLSNYQESEGAIHEMERSKENDYTIELLPKEFLDECFKHAYWTTMP